MGADSRREQFRRRQTQLQSETRIQLESEYGRQMADRQWAFVCHRVGDLQDFACDDDYCAELEAEARPLLDFEGLGSKKGGAARPQRRTGPYARASVKRAGLLGFVEYCRGLWPDLPERLFWRRVSLMHRKHFQRRGAEPQVRSLKRRYERAVEHFATNPFPDPAGYLAEHFPRVRGESEEDFGRRVDSFIAAARSRMEALVQDLT